MELDEDILRLARQFVSRLVDESVLQAPPGQQGVIRGYYESKGGLYRQLAGRVVKASRNGLRRDDVLSWAIADLRKAVLERAGSPTVASQFANWFENRTSMLRGVSARFWLYAQESTGDAKARRLAMGITDELLLRYLSVPLSVEADPAKRTAGNLAAIGVLSSGQPLGDAERLLLAGYTGWGGLSIERVADRLPAQWTPDSSALIHEYYTPPLLCFELARVLRRYVESMAQGRGSLTALEPSAGIGRFVNALSTAGFERVAWSAVEYSPTSASILRAMRPDIRVVPGAFERFVVAEEPALRGRLDLVVSNPPYGERGATMAEDPHPDYQQRKAYVYFLLRNLDLLRPSGLGAFLVPYGFLTGRSAELEGYRRRVLRRHHLMAGFRLPSSLFPGANIVTDLLLFTARGGELASVSAEDVPIVEGRYYEQFPSHILGQEVRSGQDDAPKKARFGYEVLGTFRRLPDFVERPLCSDCVVPVSAPASGSGKSASVSEVAEYLLPPEIQSAIALGKRVASYLGLLASSEEKQIERAQRQHAELLTALADFRTLWGSPRKDRTLASHAKSRPPIGSLLSAFTDAGEIAPQLREPPNYKPRYQGSAEDIVGQASHLFRTERSVTLVSLAQFRKTLGQPSNLPSLRAALIAGRWFVDGEEWLPEPEYLAGSLWPRYDRAVQRAMQPGGDDTDRAIAASQAARLLEIIAPVTLSVIEPDPRLPWVPLPSVRSWMSAFAEMDVPELERRNHYLLPKGVAVVDLERNLLPSPLVVLLGFLNYDYALFKIPNPPKEIDTTTGKEESDSSAQTRARLAYEASALDSFRRFLRENLADADVVVEAYNRTYRGYVEPTYTSFVPPSRWGSQVELRLHQQYGAARLLAHLGGLIAFDVGVGKTYTAIAVIAKLREEGKARRPVVVVPNSLLFQWLKAFNRALPNYRVLVIGAERYIGRSGALVSRTDKPEERAEKWRIFQAGGADVVLVSYTTFARAAVRTESRVAFAWSSPPLLKAFGVEGRKTEADATESEEDKKKKRKAPRKASQAQLEKQFGDRLKGMTQEELERAAEETALNLEREREADRARIRQLIASLSSYSERERAIIQNRIERWAAGGIHDRDVDPGVFWEQLGIDALFVDEAQNFKNLWPVSRVGPGGELPKYLGAIETPSQRALDLAVRASLVRRKNGGSGVYLLSATPAKNSPLEYFSLLSLVDGDAWARLGIADTSNFISRYLKIEFKTVLDTDLQEVRREVVTGFVNIPELKDIIFRLAEFRTAAEVGLKLPKTEPLTIKVPMGEQQEKVHRSLLNEYRVLISDPRAGLRNRALGILMQLSLVSIHPELVTARPDAGWSRSNWNRVSTVSSPKLEYCASEILRRRGCNHIVFVESVAAHYWLRELLVRKGIPRERIAILNAEEAPTALSRQVIAEKFNGTPPILDDQGNVEQEGEAPAYDVVIANSVANEGIDLHIHTCMVHQLDLPWEPATLQQRNGRAVRQGNTQAVIAIYYYISQGSIDAARLTIILGKLNWMKDILQSAERETNNPAAGSELSQDELVAFLYSPEELSTLRARMVQKKEEEDRRAARRRAWLLAKRVAEHATSRTKNPVELGQEDHTLRELMRQLKEIPPQTWPWHNTLLPKLVDGWPCAFFDLRYRPALREGKSAEDVGEEMIVTVPLWERAVFVSSGVQFVVGEVRKGGDQVFIRRANELEWELIEPLLLNASSKPVHVALFTALRSATPDQFDSQKWNAQVDRLATEQAILDAVSSLSGVRPLSVLGMRNAPDAWRTKIWDYWGKQILAKLPGAFPVPVAGGPLTISAAALSDKSPSPLPWTESGFHRFVERAKTSGGKWSELDELSWAWFERPFPRGVLGKSSDEGERPSAVVGAVGSLQIPSSKGGTMTTLLYWIRDGLAVTALPNSLPDTESFTVTHVATGKATSYFVTKEMAQRFAEWLLTLADWTQPDGNQVIAKIEDKERIPVIAEWMRGQKRPPSLAAIQKRFRG